MAEKMLRPDTAQVKRWMTEAARIDEQLRLAADSEAQQRTDARKAAQALFDDRVRKALEEMDVEHINRGKQGLRIGPLRDAGIENVWQLSQYTYGKLCALDGVGDQSARKIQDTVKQIAENTKDTIRVRIRVEELQPVDTALIRSLYVLVRCRPIRETCKMLYQENHVPLKEELELAKQSLKGLGWLFSSRSKKERLLQGVEGLRVRLTEKLESGSILDIWEQTANPSDEVCVADYCQNAPEYYAELEKLGLDWEQQDGTPGGLPAQLAAEIEKQGLDLTHLKATLRSYQTFGVKYIIHQKKALLGDEMGLGKTVQAIAAMAALKAKNKHHFMVVCPASVLVNWCREIQKFSDLEVIKVHGNDEQALLNWRENGGVAVTTYESISRFQLPARFPIAMIVTDEAHYVKNPETQRTKALLKLLGQTEYALFMSGTPLENRVEEMCFLISCLQPEMAGELEAVKFLSTAEQFRQQIAGVYLRRTRDDVLQELPDLIEKEQWCVLGEKELRDYRDAVMSGNFMAIRQVSWQVDDLKDSSKAARLLELCDQAKEQKRKVIVFSFFRSTLQKVITLLGDRCMEPVTGDMTPQRRQETVDAFSKAGDGAVLVCQVQAGGTGLNIQSASMIIFCEPQIKPSIENQAISRAYRMGQVRDVLVYRLLADDTVDEQIMEILKNKQNLFDNFADESVVGTESLKPAGQSWITQMVEAEQKRLSAGTEAKSE